MFVLGDQPTVPQHFEVLGHTGPSHVEVLGERNHGAPAAEQHVEDVATGPVGQRPEHEVRPAVLGTRRHARDNR